MAEKKDNSGALFKNKDRKTDTHPNARGSAMIGGVEYWVDAWTNYDKDGNAYQSLKFKVKEARTEAPAKNQAPADADDVPF